MLFKPVAIWVFLIYLITPVAAGAAESSAQDTVRQVTRAFYQALQDKEAKGSAEADVVRSLIESILIPHVDFKAMSAWVLGHYWRQASPQQQQRFIAAFRELLVNTYTSSVQLVSLDQIHYLPQHKSAKPERAVVRTEIRKPGEAPVSIDYYVHLSGSQWKVYDIRIEGISMISNYRSSFAAEIRSRGLDAVIADLEKKNAQAG